MKIYTRSGDGGKTSLFDNTRVWKNSLRVDTYGTIDELNATLGIITAEIGSSRAKKLRYILKIVIQIQKDLFVLGSSLATPASNVMDFNVNTRIAEFEGWIDEMWSQCPQLHNFILPGGGKIGAQFHVSRTVCRRAERKLIALNLEEQIDPLIIAYINRLSDLLIALSRYANHIEHKKETIWQR